MAVDPTDATARGTAAAGAGSERTAAGGDPAVRTAAGGVRSRREFTLAVVLAAAVGALGLFGGSRPWLDITVDRELPLPPVAAAVSGATVSPLVPGLSLVVLAGAVGLLATRRWGRPATGVIIAAAGVGIVLAARSWLGAVSPARARAVALDVGLPAGTTQVVSGTGAWITVLAGALAALLGAAVVLRSHRWPVMGARYDAPAAGPGDARAAGGAAAGRVDADPSGTGPPAADPSEAGRVDADSPAADRAGAVRPAATGGASDPAGPRGEAASEQSGRATWDALDRGEDPTRE